VTLTPARTATDEDTRVLLRSLAGLRAALVLAGKEIVKLNFGKRDTELLKMMRERLREAKQVAARFVPASKDRTDADSLNQDGAAPPFQTSQDPPVPGEHGLVVE
jgi:hypothetical protein